MEWTHLRKYPRVPVDLPAVYTVGAQTFHTRILTLGGGGLFLARQEPIEVGSRISIGFRPAKHLPPLEVQAEVRHVIPGEGMGVEYLELDPAYRQKLLKYILHRIGETRKGLRAPLAAQVEYEGGMQIGFTKNISVGGMFIETKKPAPSDTQLKMRFNLDDGGPIIIVEGEVRYVVRKIGMGVRFLDLALADQTRIQAYLTKAEGGAPEGGQPPPQHFAAGAQ